MMLKDTLQKIVELQKNELEIVDTGLKRELLRKIDVDLPHAIIISGIRRCGKSTLLKQSIRNIKVYYYFNFEDQRAINFEVNDFEKLLDVFKEQYGESQYLFFDEIQNIPHWERFIRRLLDEGKKCIITGSNASLLSKELGTRLTGRHITYELFPFSYFEMLEFFKEKPSRSSFEKYLKKGGFPEFLKYKKNEILQELLDDIISRDIIVKYGLREAKIIKQLMTYLLTNVGKEFSYNRLAKIFNMGSVNTIISYISYFEDSYLLFSIPKFDFSYKRQLINPKKIYCIDTGLINANSISFSEDKGRMIENVVFLELRKKYKDIYYFKENKECDFIVVEKGKPLQAIQVCTELNEENKERELSGLQEAMKKLNINTGTIITLDQEDKINGLPVIPVWKWLLKN